MTIKILLADDQCLMLEGIKAILRQQPEIEIVGTAQDGQTAIAQVEKLQPDIVLLDIEMPKMNGITATKYICKYSPNTRVIVITGHKDKSYLTQALQAGASGYLFKDSLGENLQQAIYSLSRGCFYVEAKLLTPTVNHGSKTVKRRQNIIYLRKYQKNIYTPYSMTGKDRHSTKSLKHNLPHVGISKASLAPIFDESYIAEDIDIDEAQILTQKSIYPPRRSNLRRHLKKFVLLLMAIASMILSIIIF
ncbi:response regulator transcription factor [Pleurocapsales cyanobacterium LEGE 10410]|nr:response regulator transcription factor [Pleurocapsales cyanobacterium LEGE 10410]